LEKEGGNGEKDGVRSASLAKRIFYEIDFYYPETLYYPFCTAIPPPSHRSFASLMECPWACRSGNTLKNQHQSSDWTKV